MPALWGMTSPDVLAVVNLSDQEHRREIVRTAVATLLAERSPAKAVRAS
jgi:hypothetical protein